ncbi:L,D-transpeptidase [Kineococcus glutinatus]|uniref:L,D-transpeptidase n=1 Tax=Kineococcus glutinatus TaxID=1070872 RepID=UPI0031F19436
MTSSTPAPVPAVVTVTPGDGTQQVRLDAPVRVDVSGGTLTAVDVRDASGAPLPGTTDPGGATWTSSAPLAPATAYTVRATSTSTSGLTQDSTSTLTTLAPTTQVAASVAPRAGWTVGVGMPVIVLLDEDVADDRRAEVERHLAVTTPANVEGAWHWVSAGQVQWRPREYWPADTPVHVDVDLAGVEVAPGVWGTENRDIDFRVGSAVVSTVDIQNHTLTMRENGQVINTIPVTTGKSGSGGKYVTRSGVKVIMSRESERTMDAETTGVSPDDPDYYSLEVKYAMRLTNSGEFIHAAPWSVGSQGRANVSHGCTGMSTADAKWMFEHSKVGDVVEFVGSDRGMEPGNGYTAWNMSFEEWKAASALAA